MFAEACEAYEVLSNSKRIIEWGYRQPERYL